MACVGRSLDLTLFFSADILSLLVIFFFLILNIKSCKILLWDEWEYEDTISHFMRAIEVFPGPKLGILERYKQRGRRRTLLEAFLV
jgi:hypothetical protein